MSTVKYLPASKIYREYSIPRSLLRELAEEGTIRLVVKELPSGSVMNLYCVEDIEKYMNSSDEE